MVNWQAKLNTYETISGSLLVKATDSFSDARSSVDD
jgi:hypothetical protein